MFKIKLKRVWILGVVVGFLLVLSFYNEFVQLASRIVCGDFVETISLSSKFDSAEVSCFGMGEDVVLTAKIRGSNFYFLDVYDENGSLVFTGSGTADSSFVKAFIPLSSPAFAANETYGVIFQGGLMNYPLFGVSAFSSSLSGFGVINSSTRLSFVASFDGETNELQMQASLSTADFSPVVNKTVSFYLKPNKDLPMRDRGWVRLGSRDTDENGSVLFCAAVNMMGGCHEVEARFAGDEDFGSSKNSTSFTVSHKAVRVRIVSAERRSDRVSLLLRVTDNYGFPIGGKLFSFEALNLQKSISNLISDASGYVSVSMNVARSVSFIDSRITVFGDDYTSECRMTTRLNLVGSKVTYETNYDDGVLTSDEITESYGLDRPLKTESGFQTLEGGSEDIGLVVNPNPGRADLHQRVEASILTLCRDYGTVKFYYYFNGTDLDRGGVVTASCSVIREYDEEQGWIFIYWYFGILLWYPPYFGNLYFRVEARDQDNETIGENNVSFNVQPAPANIVVYYPEAFSGDKLKLMIAFSKARTYDGWSGSDFFYSSRLAPTVLWDDVDYMLDQAIGNTTVIHVDVNGSRVADVAPDADGLCGVLIPFSFSGDYSGLDIRVVTNQSDRYEEIVIERNFTLTRVNVVDVPSAGSNSCRLDFSLKVLDDGDRAYIGVDNVVEVSASLFDAPIYNVSASVLAARGVSRSATNSSGWASVPSGINYLRVKSACYLEANMTSPLADVNRNGNVDMNDTGMVCNAFGVFGVDQRYNWTLDLNGNYSVDNADIELVTSNYGGHISYCSSDIDNYDYSGVRVDFGAGNSVYLDSRGFATVPDGVSWLNMSIGGIVEFYSLHLVSNTSTNNVGIATVEWCPEQIGVYTLQVKLPSTVNVTVAWYSNITQVTASLNAVKYFYVEKRHVNLMVDVPSEFNITTIEAEADAFVAQDFPEERYGNKTFMLLAFTGTAERWSFIRFNVSSIPTNAYILSARLNIFYFCSENSVSSPLCGVYEVMDSWNELNISWSDMPECGLDPLCTFMTLADAGLQEWLFLDLTVEVRRWHMGLPNNGVVLKKMGSNTFLDFIYSRESSDYCPVLEVSYIMPPPVAVATAIDGATQEAISGLPVSFFENGVSLGYVITNSSGVATKTWMPSSNIVYDVSASTSDNGIYRAGYWSEIFDYRFSTNITSGNAINVPTGWPSTYNFTLLSSPCFGLKEMLVKFFINGTYLNGTSCFDYREGVTRLNGTVSFEWMALVDGTYSIRAFFEGNTTYKPSELYVVVTATTIPLGVMFNVSPEEFEPNTRLTLNATILDASTGNKFSGYDVTVRFFDVKSDGNISSWNVTTHNGEAIDNSTVYPSDGFAHAYMAVIVPAVYNEKFVQGIISNPVQLTVSKNTTMLLEVSRDNSSLKHTLQGRLVHEGSGVGGKLIHIKVNDTQCLPLHTNSSGYFSCEFDLQPENDENTTYIITAMFEGDTPINATAWAKTLDGQDYPACITIQYGFKPSSNMTVLMVDPRVTELMRMVKSPEEMQKSAQNEGWLSIYHEFSWWYPWYRMHVRVHINPTIDVGFSPIFPGVETSQWSGLEAFAEVLQGFIEELEIDVGTLFLEYVLAKVLSFLPFTWIPALIALVAKFGTQVFLLLRAWSDRVKMLAVAIVNFIMALVAMEVNIGAAFINALFTIVYGGAMSALYLLKNKLISIAGPIQHTRTWLDGAEIAMDFGLGVVAYARYQGRI